VAVRRYAFGLEIVSTYPFEAALAPSRHGDASGQTTALEFVDPAVLVRSWSPRGAVNVMERRLASGRLVISIQCHPDYGYRIVAPGYGHHVVATDGTRVRSALPVGPAWRWQRLLFAQVLPLASTLRGFDLFHASAVEIGSRAYGFVAASGTGKTSVAAHLVALGAAFVTDDVMALEARTDNVCVHPGPGMVAVHGGELRAMTREGRARMGRVLGRAGKTYLAREPVGNAVPLAAIYYLERSPSVGRFSVSESQPDPRLLLSSAFIWYLRTPQHLGNHLELCARVAERVPLFTVRVPPRVSAVAVAERLMDHSARLQQ
jgi:hypothetical protein